jgi:hypothetical protein
MRQKKRPVVVARIQTVSDTSEICSGQNVCVDLPNGGTSVGVVGVGVLLGGSRGRTVNG